MEVVCRIALTFIIEIGIISLGNVLKENGRSCYGCTQSTVIVSLSPSAGRSVHIHCAK